jgi:PKD repeat protein
VNRKGLILVLTILFISSAIAPSIDLIYAQVSNDKCLIQSSYQTRLDPIIWNNYEYIWGSTFLVSQLDYEYPLNCQVADDFILEDDSRVTGVHWWGAFWSKNSDERLWPNPSDFNIIFYADDGTGNMPTGEGMGDPTSTALAVYFMSQVNGTYIGMDRYEYNVSFPAQFNTTADTKYWIAIQIVLPVFPQWGWATNGDSNPDQLHCPVQGFPLLGCPYWTDTDYGDMAFQLYGGLNYAPLPPVIHGLYNGDVNIEYDFWTDPIVDPSGDSLYCRWDWGDGNITDWDGPYSSGSVLYASHTWIQGGSYDIRAELKGVGGSSGWSDPHTINIFQNQPPVPNFTYTSDELTITFDGSSSYDPDGTITSWLWDCGDGGYGPGEIFTHVYPTSGTYNVTLTVKDNSFEEETITKSVFVVKYAPVFIYGSIKNYTYVGDTIVFDAVNIKVLSFQPFHKTIYNSGEHITLLNTHKGYLGYHFIFAFCSILV